MIGFQGEVPASLCGGINVPAAPAAFILFPVLRLVLHVFLCKGTRIRESFVSDGARASSITFELRTQGQPSRQGSKL